MLKGLFCYDGPVYLDNKGNVYDVALTNQVLSRYLSIVDALDIVIRTRVVNEIKKNTLSQITLKNIQLISIPNLSSVRGQIFKKKEVKSIIKENVKESDIIFARLPSITGSYAVNYARQYNKPYMVEVVGCPWDALWNHSLKGKIIAPFMFFATKNAIKDSPYVVYVTNNFLQRRYPCKGKTIGCSDVVLPAIDESILERRVNKINHLTNDKPIVLGTTGAVNVRYKGQDYIIKAISKLNKDGYNFEYHLVGSGDNSYLKSIAKKYGVMEKVKFLGSLPHEKVFEYLDNIDVYVQPSKQEGLPRALVEAMSKGCPCIGSNVGGIPELLNQEFVFNRGIVEEICTLLKKMDKETMLREAVRSFEKAKEYDKDLLVERRTAFYKAFVERGQKNND
jgi:glycosyltransferase involved in cell wall biosynthesis